MVGNKKIKNLRNTERKRGSIKRRYTERVLKKGPTIFSFSLKFVCNNIKKVDFDSTNPFVLKDGKKDYIILSSAPHPYTRPYLDLIFGEGPNYIL